MLRALGIAFIVCTFLFTGLLVIGLGVWAIASGTVRITGLNERRDVIASENQLAADAGQPLAHLASESRELRVAPHSPVAAFQPVSISRTLPAAAVSVLAHSENEPSAPRGAGMRLDFSITSGFADVAGVRYVKSGGVAFRALPVIGSVVNAELVVLSTATGDDEYQRVRIPGSGEVSNTLSRLPAGRQTLFAVLYQGDRELARSSGVEVEVLEGNPRVDNVDPAAFGTNGAIRIQFARAFPLDTTTARVRTSYELRPVSKDAADQPEIRDPEYDANQNLVTLYYSRDLAPGLYELRVLPFNAGNSGIRDLAGNSLDVPKDSFYSITVTKNIVEAPLSESWGIGTASTGEHIEFPEYTAPRENPSGFNPSDKVVTRVARLYYFRDAHRVLQIVNRKAKSYNRQAVDMKQQFADASRHEADQATKTRRELEGKAIQAAQSARAAENALEEHQQALIQAREDAARLTSQREQLDAVIAELAPDAGNFGDNEPGVSEDQLRRLRALREKDRSTELSADEQDELEGLESLTNTGDFRKRFSGLDLSDADLRRRESRQRDLTRTRDTVAQKLEIANEQVQQQEELVRQLMSTIQAERTREIQATERWEISEQEERLRAEEQFRREVAAKTEDPDTYAPGNIDSDDPVTQVSLSVVGEGLIQLRGPRKGVNEVHKMINQLDAPVGQVKIAIHTVQVNGEHGDRMEKVVTRIQRYLDHSRFLTIQSAEMLRNAVVTVASRQAAMVSDLCPPGTAQQVRDDKYQEAFFGAEFLQELRTLDSEFLQTGNKVLSLHSMDTTSLSNALFLMSLAKNDIREQILQEFFASVQMKLPLDELEFFEESGAEFKYRHKQFQFLGQNAKFTALRGFFSAEVAGSDTLNPMQREFIRLAQIFKSQLVTEIELRQRVMERALIEERLGDYKVAIEDAVSKEKTAAEEKQNARLAVLKSAETVRAGLAPIRATIEEVARDTSDIAGRSGDYRLASLQAQKQLTDAYFNHVVLARQRTLQTPASQDATSHPAQVETILFPVRQGNEEFPRLNARIMGFLESQLSADLQRRSPVDETRAASPEELIPDWDAAYRRISASDRSPAREAEYVERSYALYRTFIEHVPEPPQCQFRLLGDKFLARWNSASVSENTNLPVGIVIEPFDRFISEITVIHAGLIRDRARLLQFSHTPRYETVLNESQQALSRVSRFLAESQRDSTLQDRGIDAIEDISRAASSLEVVARHVERETQPLADQLVGLNSLFGAVAANPDKFDDLLRAWGEFKRNALKDLDPTAEALSGHEVADPTTGASSARMNRFTAARQILQTIDRRLGITTDDSSRSGLLNQIAEYRAAAAAAENLRRPLDHKKFLDMLVDDVEEKYIELVEGTRAQTSNLDNYLKRLGTALEDDFNAQFYHPSFRHVRETSYYYDVNVGQVETTSVVANNRMFAKVSPQATMEFDLPKRDILINEAMSSALAAYNDYGALLGDPNFLSLMKLYGGQSASTTYGGAGTMPYVQEVLPGLPSGTDAQFMTSAQNNVPRIGASLEALIPDPAIYKFETGTGYEIRPVIQPDGQAVVFHLDYMYSTNIREPVRADEKHLGRVRRHYINTDVTSGNYELREVSTYRVGLKASRTSRGVPLLEDVPGVGLLFRPLPSDESALQQNIILSQTVIYPTLFDLMGLRWAPAVADLDTLSLREREFVTRNREKLLRNEVFDYASLQVDEFIRVPEAERRGDLYRTQESIPSRHPNGYEGSGLNLRNGTLQEGYTPDQFQERSQFVPSRSEEATFPLETQPGQPMFRGPSLMHPDAVEHPESIEGAVPLDRFPPADHFPPVLNGQSSAGQLRMPNIPDEGQRIRRVSQSVTVPEGDATVGRVRLGDSDSQTLATPPGAIAKVSGTTRGRNPGSQASRRSAGVSRLVPGFLKKQVTPHSR